MKRWCFLMIPVFLPVIVTGQVRLSGYFESEYDLLSVSNEQYSFGYNILRGIEVKVSRSDFKNGFICSGCNYNYVLTPMRVLAQYEVPSGVGLIEYNKHKFSCELHSLDESNTTRRTLRLSGVRVVKKPAYRTIPQFQIDNAVSNISLRQLDSRMEILEDLPKRLSLILYLILCSGQVITSQHLILVIIQWSQRPIT